MTNKNEMTENSMVENATTQTQEISQTKEVKKRKKRKHRDNSEHCTSEKVIRNGKVMIKTRRRVKRTPNQDLIKEIEAAQGNVTPDLLDQLSTDNQEEKFMNRNRMKRLGLAAILFATLGLGTTVAAFGHGTHKAENTSKVQPKKSHVITIADVPEKYKNKFKSNEVKISKKADNKNDSKPEEVVKPTEQSEITQDVQSYEIQEEQPVQDTQSYEIQEVSTQEQASTQYTENYRQPAMSLNILGQTVYYQNGGQGSGQSIIDANSDSQASTWGGAAVFSGSDGLNTHFIGHNPGAFSVIFSLSVGNQITVTDASGTPTTYTVNGIYQVADDGTDVNSGRDMYDTITGTGGGERITLQSCINDDVNLIVFASA